MRYCNMDCMIDLPYNTLANSSARSKGDGYAQCYACGKWLESIARSPSLSDVHMTPHELGVVERLADFRPSGPGQLAKMKVPPPTADLRTALLRKEPGLPQVSSVMQGILFNASKEHLEERFGKEFPPMAKLRTQWDPPPAKRLGPLPGPPDEPPAVKAKAEAAPPNLHTIVPGLKGMARACVKTAEKYGGAGAHARRPG